MQNFSKHKNQPRGPGTIDMATLKQMEAVISTLKK